MLREVIAATLIMATAAASAAYAEGQRNRGPRGHGGPRVGAALRHLDLSDSQREAVRQLMEREREASEPLREQLRAKVREFRELRQANDPRAESLKAELESFHDQFGTRRELLRAEIDRILTPEQKQQLQEMKDRRCRDRG